MRGYYQSEVSFLCAYRFEPAAGGYEHNHWH